MRTRVTQIEDVTPGAEAVVVIDVLRAFTTSAWCLEQGVASLLLAKSASGAVSTRDLSHPTAKLLKDGAPDPRFDLANSPGALRSADLLGATVIQQTTNGTRGVFAAFEARARLVLCTGYVTAGATLRVLRNSRVEDVTFMVTGGDEDRSLAEFLCAELAGKTPEIYAYLERARVSPAAKELECLARQPGYPGIHPDDVPLALEVDRFDFVPIARESGDLIVLHPG